MALPLDLKNQVKNLEAASTSINQSCQSLPHKNSQRSETVKLIKYQLTEQLKAIHFYHDYAATDGKGPGEIRYRNADNFSDSMKNN